MIEIIWKTVRGYEGLYEVSNTGDVYSIGNNIILKQRIRQRRGVRCRYALVGLTKNKIQKKQPVHRIVATAFLENPYGKEQVNHIDGNGANNNVTNLEWCTPRENIRHSLLYLPPKANKYGNEMMGKIQMLIGKGMTHKEINEFTGVSAGQICNYSKGIKRWKAREAKVITEAK